MGKFTPMTTYNITQYCKKYKFDLSPTANADVFCIIQCI